MSKDLTDYLEYSDGTIAQRATDLAHAMVNKQTADKTQQQMVNDTAERNNLSDEEVEKFLYENYADRESTEYLVDGAILTCTNCTIEEKYIYNRFAPKESSDADIGYGYFAPIDESIQRSDFPDIGNKALGRLTVTENPAAEANLLKYATTADCVKEKNIPCFGNCLRGPDSELEMNIFDAIHKEANQGMEKRKEGSCKYLMNLESEWENYEIGQTFLSFPDDIKGDKSGITMTSMLFCKHGGFIYPVNSGQTIVVEEVEEESGEEVEEKRILPEVDASNPQSVKEFMWAFFRNEGFSEYAVAGILGNVYVETGGTFDPGIISSADYYGLFQCGDKRRDKMIEKGGENGWTDVQFQCEYAMEEYINNSDTGWLLRYLDYEDGVLLEGTRYNFENAQNASEAALIWATSFERCYAGKREEGNKIIFTSLQNQADRVEKAEEMYREFSGVMDN